MTYPNPDRDYWRCCAAGRLIEEARDSNHELCIAIGERLADADTYKALAKENEALDEHITDLEETLADLRDDLIEAETLAVKARDTLYALERRLNDNAEHCGHIFADLRPQITAWLNYADTGEEA
jgi:predicted  nucleic acid-binding Zn-ribbon protein